MTVARDVSTMRGRPWPDASLGDPTQGSHLDVSTTESGLPFYSGNPLGSTRGKPGRKSSPAEAACAWKPIVPHFPAHAHFSPAELRPGAPVIADALGLRFPVSRSAPKAPVGAPAHGRAGASSQRFAPALLLEARTRRQSGHRRRTPMPERQETQTLVRHRAA